MSRSDEFMAENALSTQAGRKVLPWLAGHYFDGEPARAWDRAESELAAIEREAVDDERARLVAGVEGLSEGVHSWYAGSNLDHVSRSAVLALIRDTEGATE